MISCRKATEADMLLYFEWANDEEVRKQSYQSEPIDLEQHTNWFYKKLNDTNCLLLLFENENKQPVGQVRFQKEDLHSFVIGISLAKEHRGKGLATELLQTAANHFLQLNPDKTINAYIKQDNEGSIKSFIKAGFVFGQHAIIEGKESVLYIKTKTDADS
jgi:RimJ/RimL family protein N-acetyltransferase